MATFAEGRAHAKTAGNGSRHEEQKREREKQREKGKKKEQEGLMSLCEEKRGERKI